MNFADVLKTAVEKIERPPLIPSGTYRAAVLKQPSFEEISDGRWSVIDFTMRLIEPMDDVDSDELNKFGPIAKTTIRHRFMFSNEDSPEAEQARNRTKFNLKRFLCDHLRLDAKGDLGELVANSLNQECLVIVKWRPDKDDPEIQYNEVKSTAPVS